MENQLGNILECFPSSGVVGKAPQWCAAEKLFYLIRLLSCKCWQLKGSASAFSTLHIQIQKYYKYIYMYTHVQCASTLTRKSRLWHEVWHPEIPIKEEKRRKRHKPAHGKGLTQQQRPGQTWGSALTCLSKSLLSPTEKGRLCQLVPEHTRELTLGMFLPEL